MGGQLLLSLNMSTHRCIFCDNIKSWRWYKDPAGYYCGHCYEKKRWQDPEYKLRKKAYNIEHRDRIRERERIRRDKNPERFRLYGRLFDAKMRQDAMYIVGRGLLKCVNCGCDKVEILEINHINGGGSKEVAGPGKTRKFYRYIVRNKRGIDDLELRCAPCNILHYKELKLGKLPFTIKWGY